MKSDHWLFSWATKTINLSSRCQWVYYATCHTRHRSLTTSTYKLLDMLIAIECCCCCWRPAKEELSWPRNQCSIQIGARLPSNTGQTTNANHADRCPCNYSRLDGQIKFFHNPTDCTEWLGSHHAVGRSIHIIILTRVHLSYVLGMRLVVWFHKKSFAVCLAEEKIRIGIDHCEVGYRHTAEKMGEYRRRCIRHWKNCGT